MQDGLWAQVERLRDWLDEEAPPAEAGDVRLLRILKISEELGEVAEAYHGATGANPRKGASHTFDDVNKELADVIVTAMVALATTADKPGQLLAEHLDGLVRRVMPEG
ncbi:MazG-like family protein [Streptomyces afghaniensis]|uniref:MazG-like family protein n=1 Tax=Streptomyces afghaniensis TaxID=66865 RepID=UPI002786FF10|nr:MazG-like family protein [Streptomyces afghaniensis]MDQ1019006.1 NTP pyrophosphatase (non-canonical NTP hydrolase) [Streptomyces afghaniensis]